MSPKVKTNGLLNTELVLFCAGAGSLAGEEWNRVVIGTGELHRCQFSGPRSDGRRETCVTNYFYLVYVIVTDKDLIGFCGVEVWA